MLKKTTILFIFLITLNMVSAATIHGIVYDLSLNKVDKAIININTVPEQVYISVNGSYSFHVPNGNYKIKANLIQNKIIVASASQDIVVNSDEDFKVDLILFPNLEEEISLIKESDNIDFSEEIFKEKTNFLIYIFILLFVAIIIFALFFIINKERKKKKIPKKEGLTERKLDEELLPDDSKELVKVIRDNENRITQKELRKKTSFSETKISLMLAELEDKGIVRKIKKGRGNIIILEKE